LAGFLDPKLIAKRIRAEILDVQFRSEGENISGGKNSLKLLSLVGIQHLSVQGPLLANTCYATRTLEYYFQIGYWLLVTELLG